MGRNSTAPTNFRKYKMFCKNAKKWFETLPMFTNVHLARDNFHLFNLNDLATVSPDSIHPPNSPDQSEEELNQQMV